MTDMVRIFVNSRPVDGEPGESVIGAISRWDSELAEQLNTGKKALSDSRGLSIALDTVVYNGAIFRVVSARQLQEILDPFEGVV